MRPDFPSRRSRDLDIAVVGKLAAVHLPLGDEFEPGAMKMVGFERAFRRGGLWKGFGTRAETRERRLRIRPRPR
jgi:hypothetical protein